MKISCYLGEVPPEDLFNALCQRGLPEDEAAGVVDRAIEEECRRRKQAREAEHQEKLTGAWVRIPGGYDPYWGEQPDDWVWEELDDQPPAPDWDEPDEWIDDDTDYIGQEG